MLNTGATTYLTSKTPSNFLFVLVPGGPGLGHQYFSKFAEQLSERHSVLAFDPGVRNLSNSYSVETLAIELNQMIREFAVNNRKIVLVGHSFSSLVVLKYCEMFAADLPLVLISWVFDSDWLNVFVERTPEYQDIEEKISKLNQFEKNPELIFKNQTAGYLDLYFPVDSRLQGKLLFETLRFYPEINKSVSALEVDHIAIEALKRFSAPVLSICGANDRVVYADYTARATELTARIEHHVLENAGHFPFVEKQTNVIELIEKFILKLKEKK